MSEPVKCRALKTLEELYSFEVHCCAAQKPVKLAQPLAEGSRVLLCHDFKGGYLYDSFHCTEEEICKMDGYDARNDYKFDHWDRIDIFVYFAHTLCAVPPCSWIEKAHRNGVFVLGTINIENDKELAHALIATETRDIIVEKLVKVCERTGFDGWFFNMEVEIEKTRVPHMIAFVEQLKQKLKESNPTSLVIWYDSMITSGELQWKNALTEENKAFFDVCDGFFTNYAWVQDDLVESRKLAGHRAQDVYVGFDVFARGTNYKGGLETPQEAKEVGSKNDLSVAIFAPGWVLEELGCERFAENQCKFWEPMPKRR